MVFNFASKQDIFILPQLVLLWIVESGNMGFSFTIFFQFRKIWNHHTNFLKFVVIQNIFQLYLSIKISSVLIVSLFKSLSFDNFGKYEFFVQYKEEQLFSTHVTPAPRWHKEEIFWSKQQKYRHINQGSDGNRTKIRRLKVTDIDNNAVAFPYILKPIN